MSAEGDRNKTESQSALDIAVMAIRSSYDGRARLASIADFWLFKLAYGAEVPNWRTPTIVM